MKRWGASPSNRLEFPFFLFYFFTQRHLKEILKRRSWRGDLGSSSIWNTQIDITDIIIASIALEPLLGSVNLNLQFCQQQENQQNPITILSDQNNPIKCSCLYLGIASENTKHQCVYAWLTRLRSSALCVCFQLRPPMCHLHKMNKITRSSSVKALFPKTPLIVPQITLNQWKRIPKLVYVTLLAAGHAASVQEHLG